MKGITFIGMAGAGKSAVGKIAAEILNWDFVDLDKLIFKAHGMSHHRIMQEQGEQALKALEEELTLGLDLNDIVFAPPGSMIYSDKAMQKIKNNSIIVYLETQPQTIQKRLGKKLYKNGIIGLEEKGLAGIMAERVPLYEKYADYTFLSGEQSKAEMAKKVIGGLKAAGVELNAIL